MKARKFVTVLLILSFAAILLIACQTKELTSAKVYIQQDNWVKAKEQLELAVQNYPNDPEAQYLLGEAYAKESNWTKMNEAFNKSLEIAPKFETQIANAREKAWVTTFNAGVVKVNANDNDGAIKDFKDCLLINPKRIETYKNLAVTYMRISNYEEAEKIYRQALEVVPNDLEIMQNLVQVLFELKKFDQIVEIEKKIIETDPNNIDAVVNIAMAYDMLGQKDEAQDAYEKALQKNPNDKDLLFNLGRLNFINNDYDKAIELFSKVISISPDDYDSNLNVGNAYLTMGDSFRKNLVKKESEGAKIDESDYDDLKNFYKKAIPFLEKAVSIKDDNANIWNNLGVAYVNIGEAEKGQDAFKKAEELKQ